MVYGWHSHSVIVGKEIHKQKNPNLPSCWMNRFCSFHALDWGFVQCGTLSAMDKLVTVLCEECVPSRRYTRDAVVELSLYVVDMIMACSITGYWITCGSIMPRFYVHIQQKWWRHMPRRSGDIIDWVHRLCLIISWATKVYPEHTKHKRMQISVCSVWKWRWKNRKSSRI